MLPDSSYYRPHHRPGCHLHWREHQIPHLLQVWDVGQPVQRSVWQGRDSPGVALPIWNRIQLGCGRYRRSLCLHQSRRPRLWHTSGMVSIPAISVCFCDLRCPWMVKLCDPRQFPCFTCSQFRNNSWTVPQPRCGRERTKGLWLEVQRRESLNSPSFENQSIIFVKLQTETDFVGGQT